ncbi:hypothetical protein L9F63_011292, partial [Diploptera punctata]
SEDTTCVCVNDKNRFQKDPISNLVPCKTQFGYLISCISSSLSMALAIGPPIIIPFLLFGGFFLNNSSVPPYLKWLSYLSWFKYGNEALLINQWSDIQHIECTHSNSTCPKNGQVVLEALDFREDDLGLDLVCLVSLILAFRLVAFLALLSKTFLQEPRFNKSEECGPVDKSDREVLLIRISHTMTSERGILHQLGRGYGEWNPSKDGVTLTWRDVSVYSIIKDNFVFCSRSKLSLKRIINNVTGAVKPGSLVAMMGSSGAGKSTLMAALAYRNPAGMLVEGDIRINGRPLGDYMHRLSGFMHQEDLFVSSLTVKEHLNFMAKLRLDRRMSAMERQRKVAELLMEMGLTSVVDTRIGTMGQDKVLSGGEKKRLAFATELLTNPPLLFCDEPTTGLDSFSAQKLVAKMKQMAFEGRTILCTIHQPSSELFDMFHQLILVANGRIAFIGNKKSALEFFKSHGYECPKTFNPADFFVQTLAMTPGAEEASRQAVKKLCDEFAVSDAAREVDLLVQFELHMGSSYEHTCDITIQHFKSPFWFTKLQLLIHRSVLQVLRDPSVQALRILQKVGIAIMVGLCYVGTILETQTGVQSVQGALFILVTENTFSPMYSVLATFPLELPLFMREYRSGLYPTHLYYFSKILAMLPGLILEPVIFVMVIYWLAGLRSSLYAFVMTIIITILTMNVSTACGCFFSNAFDSTPLAMAYLVPFDYVLMITSGLFIKLSTLPQYISWAQYLSWLMYSNEALSILQWVDVYNITCETRDRDIPCLSDGSEVLNKFSFSTIHFWRDIFAMIALYILFHILGYSCLYSRARTS